MVINPCASSAHLLRPTKPTQATNAGAHARPYFMHDREDAETSRSLSFTLSTAATLKIARMGRPTVTPNEWGEWHVKWSGAEGN